jgi:hypothetical protein
MGGSPVGSEHPDSQEDGVTAPDPGSARDAASPPNTLSYIAIACGILALIISWFIFGILAIALSLVARGRHEPRWKTALGVAVAGTVLGLLSVLLLN